MITIQDRYKSVLREHGISIAKFAEEYGEAMRAKINRQINGNTTLTFDVVDLLLTKFPEVSAEWLTRGEGLQERTRIITQPTNRQEIHLADGARAAISQSGSANMEPDEPIGQESIASLLEEKDKLIASLQHDISILKDTIRILSAK